LIHHRLRQGTPRRLLPVILLGALPVSIPPAAALDAGREDVAGFVAEMSSRHGFEASSLNALFAQVESRPSIVAAMKRPAEKTMPWNEYRARFITERRVARGVEVGRAQAGALDNAAAKGVPTDVLLAIVGVETAYGENVGKHRVLDALSTLAFDYPPRSAFFRGELEQYLLMTREESLDPLAPLGSYAGAMGIPQFMPSSFNRWAVDGDGDGHRDLWNDWADVFASVANYLAAHGWRAGEPVMVRADAADARLEDLPGDKLALSETVKSLQDRGVRFTTSLPADAPAVLVPLIVADGIEYRVGFTNFYAITRYNRSLLYASAVNDLAEAIAAANAPPTGPAPFTTQ
jgi:membrane-bound lytic murein transglycosylase B